MLVGQSKGGLGKVGVISCLLKRWLHTFCFSGCCSMRKITGTFCNFIQRKWLARGHIFEDIKKLKVESGSVINSESHS